MADRKSAGQPVAGRKKPFAKWSRVFLSELAATSNVSAAARKAGIHASTAYDTRRQNPEFNRAWQAALCEGYDHLEMELLHRLRTGEIKPAPQLQANLITNRNFIIGIKADKRLLGELATKYPLAKSLFFAFLLFTRLITVDGDRLIFRHW